MLFRKMISNLKPFFSRRYERCTKGTFKGFLGCGSWVTLLGMRKIVVKYEIEASYCQLCIYAWFKFFQRNCAGICVKHQMSFSSVLEGWPKSDSSVILTKSQKGALVGFKQDENVFWEPALSGSG